MQNAHGDGNSDASIQNASHVSGANSVTVVSGGDTNIIGSQVNGKQITADVGGDLNIASAQDLTTSAAHQSSAGGGFTISQGGGSASFSAQNGHADSNYAGVNEQAGLHAGSGGFDINVKGRTNLKGAVIASDADASKNTLTTGTLSFSDIQNQSHYSAASNGISAGAGVGITGKATGPGSVSGSGGPVPMMSQDENGDQSAATRSAISAGAINITNRPAQTQDVASLSRDTTNTNGTVSKTPDVNDILNKQADTMQAAQAAGQVVAQGIGAYADMKRDDAVAALQSAKDRGDTEGMAAALVDYNNWREGGDSRAELHAGGGALIGGLGGGSAFSTIGGAAGAGIASHLAPQTKEFGDAVAGAADSSLIGNLAGNIASGIGGAIIGGTAGAAGASNVNLYNQGNNTGEDKARRTVEQAIGVLSGTTQRQAIGNLIDQFIGMVKNGATAKMSEPPTDLMAQGTATGIAAGIGMGGGKPPAQSPSAVLVDGAAQALAGGAASSGSTIAGYDDGYATLSKSPNSEMREKANASGNYVNPLTGEVTPADSQLAADHIVPQNWIKQQPGFDQLTPAQQSVLLNDPANTQGLPTSFNSSKGAKMPGDWTTYKGQPLDPGYVENGAAQAAALRDYLSGQINTMLGK